MSVLNAGAVGIANITVQGPDSSCTATAAFRPWLNESTGCVVHKSVSQSDFDLREANEASPSTVLAVAVQAVADSAVPGVVVSTSTDSFPGLKLPIYRNMSVTTSLDKTVVDAKGALCGFVWLQREITCAVHMLHAKGIGSHTHALTPYHLACTHRGAGIVGCCSRKASPCMLNS